MCVLGLFWQTASDYSDLLDDLLDDLTGGTRGSGLFFDNVIHLGGDEVNTACYESTPSIAAWLKKNGLTADGGYESFVKHYQAIAHSKGRDVAGWEEMYVPVRAAAIRALPRERCCLLGPRWP